MGCSRPGLPVHHQLPEFTQTHVHRVSDAIQPFHSLSNPSPPTFNLFSIRVVSSKSVLRTRWPKDWSFSFNIIPSNEHWFPLGWTSWISLQSKGLSRVFSNTTVQRHQFFHAQLHMYKGPTYTWTSLDGQHWNQIDYILYSQRWRSSIKSAKTRLGADCGSSWTPYWQIQT